MGVKYGFRDKGVSLAIRQRDHTCARANRRARATLRRKSSMAKDAVVKKSRITIDVGLDGRNMPVSMKWAASDNPAGQQPQDAKAMLLALFDERTKETLKIDLWTKEMQVVEMDRMYYQTLRGLADTYFRATQNKELANQMQQFVFYFGQATGAIPKEDE